MKTLNEVTTVLEECFLKNRKEWCIENCPYLQNNEQTCRKDVLVDALHYLKEYREKQNILKGKWQVTSIKGETWGVCSNCNFKQKAGELNFCPHCGADMRGG